jgi:hypothetical protein
VPLPTSDESEQLLKIRHSVSWCAMCWGHRLQLNTSMRAIAVSVPGWVCYACTSWTHTCR